MQEVHQPHSNFVIGTIKKRRDFAKAIFRVALSPEIINRLDIDSLQVEDTTFVDESLREHRSDILFTVPEISGGHDCNIYLLFEHKSYPDPNILDQLLRYLREIHEQQTTKAPILTVVFYHGKKEWDIARSFHELYAISGIEVEDYGDQIFNLRYGLLDAGQMDIQGLQSSLGSSVLENRSLHLVF